jgi:hypothetical protein
MPVPPPSRSPDTLTPLDGQQLMWLRLNAYLPVIFALVIVLFLAAALSLVYWRLGSALPVKIFVGIGALLLVAVTVATAMHVANNWRDAALGHAYVRRALLQRKRETTQRTRTYYLEFADMKPLIVMKEVYDSVTEHQTYRVTYSPHTRRGWSVDQRLA